MALFRADEAAAPTRAHRRFEAERGDPLWFPGREPGERMGPVTDQVVALCDGRPPALGDASAGQPAGPGCTASAPRRVRVLQPFVFLCQRLVKRLELLESLVLALHLIQQ